MKNDPYCEGCMETSSGAVIEDRQHYFCSCTRVFYAWQYVRELIHCLLPVHMKDIVDSAMLLLRIPKTSVDEEITWLLSEYVRFVWDCVNCEGAGSLSKEKLFGFLTFKYRLVQNYFGLDIPGLN